MAYREQNVFGTFEERTPGELSWHVTIVKCTCDDARGYHTRTICAFPKNSC